MKEQEKKEIIREAVQLMVKFHLENRCLKLHCVTPEFVDMWLERQEKKEGSV